MDTSRLIIKNDKVKHSGQVFTPDYLVNEILDCAGYVGQSVLRKHVIDNSCGDGAFLCVLLERYSTAFLSVNDDKSLLKKELETYIHGIEIDEEAYLCCIENLDLVASSFGLTGVKWDVLNSDALLEHGYDGKMDFVVGNPPYVRVHNLNDSYDDVKSHQFANGGMTDLYLVFFEIGLDMLKNGGCLCYITPSSWINSLAGTNMRAYIQRTHCMNELIDLGHFQPFKATTYTMIAKMVKGIVFDSIDYYSYDGAKQAKVFVEKLGYDDVFIQSNLVLGSLSAVKEYADVVRNNYNSLVKVKNGFATLADKVFISDDFPFEDYVIDVIKASTGKWRKAFFPYNKNGKPYSKQEIFSNAELSDYLVGNKKELLKGRSEVLSPEWYLYGRTQALKDVFIDKYSINTVIRDVDSVKINVVKSGQGLYSGLYIMGDVTYDELCKILKSERFINYVKLLKNTKVVAITHLTAKIWKFISIIIWGLLSKTRKKQSRCMTNNDFLNAVCNSFEEFLKSGTSRSTKKLKPLPGAIAKDIAERLGDGYTVVSQGWDGDKEEEMQGRYINKKVDITVMTNDKAVAGIGVKFVMQNYSQNSNNYFENMLGETANIRANNHPYFQVFIIFDKLPHYDKSKNINAWETITIHNIEKYKTLSQDNIETFFHTPNKLLMYVVHIPDNENLKTSKEYLDYYKNKKFKMTLSSSVVNDFGSGVILNDYEEFASKVYHSIMAI